MTEIKEENTLQNLDFIPYFTFLRNEKDKYIGIVFGHIFLQDSQGISAVSKNKISKEYGIGRNRVGRIMNRLQEMGLIDGLTSSTKEDSIVINHQKLKILARHRNNSKTNFKDLLD